MLRHLARQRTAINAAAAHLRHSAAARPQPSRASWRDIATQLSPHATHASWRRTLATQDTKEAAAKGEGEGAASAADSELQKLTAALAERDEQIAQLNERTLRILAEMENVRAIARRDVDNARKYGIMRFAKALLGVADNLGLALASVPPETLETEGAEQLKGLHTGIQATQAELLKVFAQSGVVPFGAVGDAFDPQLHQAMYEAPAEDGEGGVILDVTKVGYTIDERVLRPAEVGVSKKS